MDNIVEINNLTKKYGHRTALDDISISVKRGKIVGLLGPNGSGKTTLIKLLAALLVPNKGYIHVERLKPGVKTKALVAYLPDKDFLYKWMRVKDGISFFKDFFEDFDEKKAYELLQFMKLDPEQKIKHMSKGNLERLNLSLILSRKAKLYLLDEPLAAVDPATRDKIIDAILNNFNPESSIILSTHLVRDVERLFDEVIFLSEGKIILHKDVEDLRGDTGKSVEDVFKEVFR